MEIRRSYNRLISAMGFPFLVRWHLYIESGPRLLRPRISNGPRRFTNARLYKITPIITSQCVRRVKNTRNLCILNVYYFIHSFIGEIILLNRQSNHAHFHSRKYTRKHRLPNGHRVVSALSVFVIDLGCVFSFNIDTLNSSLGN